MTPFQPLTPFKRMFARMISLFIFNVSFFYSSPSDLLQHFLFQLTASVAQNRNVNCIFSFSSSASGLSSEPIYFPPTCIYSLPILLPRTITRLLSRSQSSGTWTKKLLSNWLFCICSRLTSVHTLQCNDCSHFLM